MKTVVCNVSNEGLAVVIATVLNLNNYGSFQAAENGSGRYEIFFNGEMKESQLKKLDKQIEVIKYTFWTVQGVYETTAGGK